MFKENKVYVSESDSDFCFVRYTGIEQNDVEKKPVFPVFSIRTRQFLIQVLECYRVRRPGTGLK